MAETDTIEVALPDKQIAAIEAVVESGEYGSASDIVREAVRDWQLKRALSGDEAERLGRLWDEGIASGPAGEVDFRELRNEVRRRIESAGKTR
jgi:antitoxin ParD1/3/4